MSDVPLRRLSLRLAVLALCALALCAPAGAATIVRLHANRIAFYYDRFLIEADGNVRVQTSDGMTVTGQAFTMDLRLNRFMVAGHVHVDSPSGSQDGAALADFLSFNRIYFVPITTEPDRWTFINGDFKHPVKGMVMPGDTFYFPDLAHARVYLYARSAVIGAQAFVRFGPSRVALVGHAYVPFPSYYLNFSTNQNLGANSLAGANFDGTYQFAGNANAISAVHVRYDTVNKAYLSFEQHLSSKKAYAVFSLNPATTTSKYWNLLLDDRPSKTFEIQTFTQLHTVQYGLGQPFQAQQLTNVQLTQALKRAFLQGNYQFFNASLLPPFAPNINAGAINAFFPYHPSNASLGISTSDEQFGKLPFFERMRFGFGFQHNSYGLQTIGGVPYTTIWSHYAGFTIYSNPIRIGDPMKRFTDLYLNAILDKQRTWNSTPHYIDTTSTTFSLSKTFSQHLSSYLMYNVSNTGDFYTNGLQSVAYAPFVPTLNGISYPGYAAFHGQATLRTLSLGATYTNLDYFTFSLLARQHKDFPAPIPFLFALPPTNVLGQFLYPNSLGQPVFDITGDLRFRLNPHMSIDISRSYYFNYENLRWTPQFVFQVMQ